MVSWRNRSSGYKNATYLIARVNPTLNARPRNSIEALATAAEGLMPSPRLATAVICQPHFQAKARAESLFQQVRLGVAIIHSHVLTDSLTRGRQCHNVIRAQERDEVLAMC
jgi:hypothetical protein